MADQESESQRWCLREWSSFPPTFPTKAGSHQRQGPRTSTGESLEPWTLYPGRTRLVQNISKPDLSMAEMHKWKEPGVAPWLWPEILQVFLLQIMKVCHQPRQGFIIICWKLFLSVKLGPVGMMMCCTQEPNQIFLVVFQKVLDLFQENGVSGHGDGKKPGCNISCSEVGSFSTAWEKEDPSLDKDRVKGTILWDLWKCEGMSNKYVSQPDCKCFASLLQLSLLTATSVWSQIKGPLLYCNVAMPVDFQSYVAASKERISSSWNSVKQQYCCSYPTRGKPTFATAGHVLSKPSTKHSAPVQEWLVGPLSLHYTIHLSLYIIYSL